MTSTKPASFETFCFLRDWGGLHSIILERILSIFDTDDFTTSMYSLC
jgi:hypothetical protein